MTFSSPLASLLFLVAMASGVPYGGSNQHFRAILFSQQGDEHDNLYSQKCGTNTGALFYNGEIMDMGGNILVTLHRAMLMLARYTTDIIPISHCLTTVVFYSSGQQTASHDPLYSNSDASCTETHEAQFWVLFELLHRVYHLLLVCLLCLSSAEIWMKKRSTCAFHANIFSKFKRSIKATLPLWLILLQLVFSSPALANSENVVLQHPSPPTSAARKKLEVSFGFFIGALVMGGIPIIIFWFVCGMRPPSEAPQMALQLGADHHIHLPVSTFYLADTEEEEDRQCQICAEFHEEESPIIRMPCCGKGVLHPQCIEKWLLEGHASCPYCRANMATISSDQDLYLLR